MCHVFANTTPTRRSDWIVKSCFVLFTEPDLLEKYNSCDSHQNMSQFLKKGRSLFVVVPTAPLQNYENFTRAVLSHNKKEPFNFEIPPIFIKNSFETVRTSVSVVVERFERVCNLF